MKLIHLLPFMDSEELTELAHKIINKEVKGVPIVTLYPFLDSSVFQEIVDKLIEEKQGKQLYSALPFMSEKALTKLYKAVKDGELPGFKEHALLPFLPKSTIKEMFDDLVKNANEAPETDEDDLSDIISDAISDAFDEEK